MEKNWVRPDGGGKSESEISGEITSLLKKKEKQMKVESTHQSVI